jgi:hypothetical protein
MGDAYEAMEATARGHWCKEADEQWRLAENYKAERDALAAEVERLREDGATRLAVAENAAPSNIRVGQVREIRWWLQQLDKAALAQSPQTGGDHE